MEALDAVTLKEAGCMNQAQLEDIIGSHHISNSDDVVRKVMDIRRSNGSFVVQVQFQKAAGPGLSTPSMVQRSAQLPLQAFLRLRGATLALENIKPELRELRDQALKAQLRVIQVKGQEPFVSGPGLVMVTAWVCSKADGVRLLRFPWHDYRLLWGARKAFEARPDLRHDWENWEQRWQEASKMHIVADALNTSPNPDNLAEIQSSSGCGRFLQWFKRFQCFGRRGSKVSR